MDLSVDPSVVSVLFEAARKRSIAIDVALFVDVTWMDSNKDVFGSLLAGYKLFLF